MITPRAARLVVVWAFLLVPTGARAQSETGTIAGVVKDTSGAVMPGVTVEAASPVLIERIRSVVTDHQGLYQIVDLRPGEYTITFTLPGFNMLRREGVELTTGFTATVNAELKVGVLAETVTVSGMAPVVDTRNVQQQTTIPRNTLDALPIAGRPSQFITLIPAANMGTTTSHDVGGVGTDRGFFGVHGQRADDMTFNFAGMDSRVFSGGSFQYNKATFEEVVVETGAGSAEATTGGVQINIIPKDGGNQLSGSLSAEYTGPGLSSDNATDELRARGLSGAPSIKTYHDIGGGLGGPIKRDTLWFFTAGRVEDRAIYQAGNYYNKRQGTLFYEPDLTRRAFNHDYSKDASLRLTWQAAAKHKIVASHTQHPSCQCVFAILETTGATNLTRAPEAAAEHHYDPQYLSVLTYTNPVTNKLLIEVNGSMNSYQRNQKRLPETGVNDIAVVDQALNLEYGSRRTGYQLLHDYRFHERFAVSYITGSHNFKVGVDLNHFEQGSSEYSDANLINLARSYRFRNQVPNQVTIYNTPNGPYDTATENGVYAQDQWTTGKLTLNLGLRYTVYDAFIPAQHLPAGPFEPARDFPAVEHSPRWQNLSPRLGIAYDLSGTGKTALKASLGRYPIRNVGAAVDYPSARLAASTARTWTDTNGNYIPDCDLLNPKANGECGGWDDLSFASPGTHRAPDALTGFNAQSYNWQTSISAQHELRPNVGLNIAYYRTWYGGFLVSDNLTTPGSSYDSYCITIPSDSRLPNAGQPLCGLYDVQPSLFGQQDNLVTQATHYGQQTEIFQGIDLILTGRFARGARAQATFSTGQTVNDTCDFNNLPQVQTLLIQGVAAPNQALPSSVMTPRTPAFCHISTPWSGGTAFGFNVVYPLPWNLQGSAIYQDKPGFPITATYVPTNAEIKLSLGRNLSDCNQAAATCSANRTISLIPPNTLFDDRIRQLDLRLSRIFPVRKAKLQGNLDVYNVFNGSTILNEQTRFSSTNNQFMNAIQIMGGRLFKLSAQLNF
jgi:hypothetical protein